MANTKAKAAVRALKSKRAPASPAPAKRDPVKAPKLPGDELRAPGKRGPKPTSDNPEAIRARKRRAAAKNKGARPVESVMTPEALTQPAEPVTQGEPLTGPVRPLVSGPEARATAEKSLAGMVKLIGIVLATFWGDGMKVSDADAEGTAALALDAYPEWANMGDTTKVLFWGAVGSMVYERAKIVRGAPRERKPTAEPVKVTEDAAPAPPVAVAPLVRPSGVRPPGAWD